MDTIGLKNAMTRVDSILPRTVLVDVRDVVAEGYGEWEFDENNMKVLRLYSDEGYELVKVNLNDETFHVDRRRLIDA